MQKSITHPLTLLVLIMLATGLACGLSPAILGGDPAETVPADQESPSPGRTVSEPGGAVLTLQEGALSEETDVSLHEIGTGEPFTAVSPFTAASHEYEVDFGGASQTGEITMTVPLNGSAKEAAPAQDQVFLVWNEPEAQPPSVIGAKVEDGKATFPVVGSGRYQLFAIASPEALQSIVSLFDPLTVPTYPQRTPAWCSPTALTDLVQYHQGAWPSGGFGSVWGESSNWYLAGQAGQPFDSGYFFHWLLGAGGYSVPSNVKQSFSNPELEVIIWNWHAAVWEYEYDPANLTFTFTNPAYAEFLFNAFQAYVESYLWGLNGPRRPVAWGSSLAGHSRVITGSDGTTLYYNDPSSGSLNSTRSWQDYRDAVLASLTAEKIEVIDTVVLHAEPRPDNARLGVVWLTPYASPGDNGSIQLQRGPTHQETSYWHWDGTGTRAHGFYYDDPSGELPDDPEFDNAFNVKYPEDELELSYTIFNISDAAHDFALEIELFDENGIMVPVDLEGPHVPLDAGQKYTVMPPTILPLQDLSPGWYRLKFTLGVGTVVQDVKHVMFRLAPPEYVLQQPSVVLIKNAFCRIGPDPVFDAMTALEVGAEVDILGFNAERTWAKIQLPDSPAACWISLSTAELKGDPDQVSILPSPPIPEPPPSDNKPPQVSISHSPSGSGQPTDVQRITFTATASDDGSIAKIEIWVTPPGSSAQLLKTCTNTTSCSVVGGPYSAGNLTYLAKAWDGDGNLGQSSPQTISVFVAVR